MSRRHVLLIEDEDDIREVAALSLEAVGGWQVSSAGGGAAGVEIAREEHPDAILLDVMMPDIDGPATLRRLQTDPRTQDIPVIFLTAKAQLADRRSFAELGVVGTVTKPFDPMTLADQVDAILRGGDATP
jgi:two-component system alkaline phosphatase synthesis response regulator PhoP